MSEPRWTRPAHQLDRSNPRKSAPPATAPDTEIPRLVPSSPPAGPVQQPPEQKNDKSLSGPAHQLVRTTAVKTDSFEQKQPNTSKLKPRLQEDRKSVV